eukprot:2279358-Rhodomonas_salina.1
MIHCPPPPEGHEGAHAAVHRSTHSPSHDHDGHLTWSGPGRSVAASGPASDAASQAHASAEGARSL